MQVPWGLLQILVEDNVRDYEVIEGLRDYEEQQDGRRIIAARAEAQGLTVGEYLGRRATLARLHRRAESLGLAYWPALRQRGVDPRAFVAAERVLSSQVGSLWGEILPDGTRSHGGWDSWGHYGVSPREVADAWFAAGCRDTGKFRLQIAAGIVARKGDTLPWLRAYVRGCRWLWGNRLMGLPWSRQAMAALGKISPELRRAAIGNFFADGGRPAGTIRIRHLDWAEVARVQAILRGGSVRARAALAGMRRACELLGCQDDELAAEQGFELVHIGDHDAFTVGPEFVHGAGAFEAVAVEHPAAALRLAPDFFVGVFQNANRAPVGQPPQFEAVALHVFNLMD